MSIIKKLTNILENIKAEPNKGTDEQNIRLLLSQEYEAVKTYQEFAQNAYDDRVKNILLDIADEEKVHIKELERVLQLLNVDDDKFETQGNAEVNKVFNENFPINNPLAYFLSVYKELFISYKRNPSSYNKGRLDQLKTLMQFLLGHKATQIMNQAQREYYTK